MRAAIAGLILGLGFVVTQLVTAQRTYYKKV